MDTQTTETQTSEVVESPNQEVSTTTKTETGAQVEVKPGGDGVTPVQPENQYQPNFKYKAQVRDEKLNSWIKKELEFDEWVRPVVKSKEQEEKLRELYAKANGIEAVTESRARIAQNYENLNKEYTQLYTEVSDIMNLRKEGDWDNFFQRLGISEKEIVDHLVQKHNLSQLPPEQQKIYNERNAYKQQQREFQNNYSQLENNYRNMEVRVLNFELQTALQNPEVSQVQKNYDNMHGEGSFKEFVKDMALARFHQTGQDPTAEEAIRLAIQRAGNAYRETPTQAPYQPSVAGEKPLPVIPKVGGANMSPTKKSPKTVDDLRRLSKEMQDTA